MPRVSVIINIRNGELFLRDTIDSVLAQSYGDFELIAFDDCSTDGSREIVQSYQDSRIRLIRSEAHYHLGAARHQAVLASRGEWIAWIDQDDLWTKDKLFSQMQVVAQEPGADLGLIYTRATRFFPDGTELEYCTRFIGAPLPRGDIFLPLLAYGNFVVMSSTLVRRIAYDTVVEQIRNIEVAFDYWLFTELARDWKVGVVDDVACRYRIHSNNMSWSYGRKAYGEALMLLERWKDDIPRDLYRRRHRIWSTIVGVEEIRAKGYRMQGVRRIARFGSLPYLLSRPFVRLARRIRWQRGKPRLVEVSTELSQRESTDQGWSGP